MQRLTQADPTWLPPPRKTRTRYRMGPDLTHRATYTRACDNRSSVRTRLRFRFVIDCCTASTWRSFARSPRSPGGGFRFKQWEGVG